jgi:hypothetical protein
MTRRSKARVTLDNCSYNVAFSLSNKADFVDLDIQIVYLGGVRAVVRWYAVVSRSKGESEAGTKTTANKENCKPLYPALKLY